MCLDLKLRKWTVHKNTLKGHRYPGCLVTQDHLFLYVFSDGGGVERRFTNNDYTSWEKIKTDIKSVRAVKLYPDANENIRFFIFGGTKTR